MAEGMQEGGRVDEAAVGDVGGMPQAEVAAVLGAEITGLEMGLKPSAAQPITFVSVAEVLAGGNRRGLDTDEEDKLAMREDARRRYPYAFSGSALFSATRRR